MKIILGKLPTTPIKIGESFLLSLRYRVLTMFFFVLEKKVSSDFSSVLSFFLVLFHEQNNKFAETAMKF
ncbi:MAG: hypothetical protein ACTSSG_10085 [Candidatus Heimdallarchaeaceae archaeon]